jgi:hypothetical protein
MVPVDFVEQLEDNASAETVNLLDETLATKPPLRLRAIRVLD